MAISISADNINNEIIIISTNINNISNNNLIESNIMKYQ